MATPTTSAEKPKRASRAKKVTAPVAVNSIKGFNSDLTCRGFQFEIGKAYSHDGTVEACVGGFHACDADQHPLSVFEFYAPAGSRYCDVVQGGALSRQVGCSKVASATITIGVEITIGELVKRAWDYVWSRATKSDENHVTGDLGAASATGDLGAASATGYQGAASATGTRGAAVSSYVGKVMGHDGNALFAIERDGNLDIVSVAAGIVGRDGIEAGVWYVASAGKLVQA